MQFWWLIFLLAVVFIIYLVVNAPEFEENEDGTLSPVTDKEYTEEGQIENKEANHKEKSYAE